jgi:hypothetical protein
MSCIVIFNLALAHHLRANRMEQHQKHGGCCHMDDEAIYADLQKARQLYEISLKMRRDMQKSASPENCSHDIFFMLAVFNNLGLVHRRLQNQEASNRCFHHVLSTLMCLTDAGYVDRLSSKLDGFFVNVTPLIFKTPVARAA